MRGFKQVYHGNIKNKLEITVINLPVLRRVRAISPKEGDIPDINVVEREYHRCEEESHLPTGL